MYKKIRKFQPCLQKTHEIRYEFKKMDNTHIDNFDGTYTF